MAGFTRSAAAPDSLESGLRLRRHDRGRARDSAPVAGFTDPDPASTAGEYSATVDWGDGSPTSTGPVAGPTGGPFTVNGSHAYADEGTYKASATINDIDDSNKTARESWSATVGE